MKKTLLAASLALALTATVVGNAAHAQKKDKAQAGQETSAPKATSANATLVPQPPTLVNTTTADFQDLRTSNALDDGGYLLVWATTTYNPERDGSRFFLQRFDSEGKKVGGETRLQTTVQDGSIGVLTNGEIVIAYGGARDAQGKIITSPNAVSGAFFQKFDVSGAQIMRETAVATTPGTATNNGSPTVVPLANGDFVVEWTTQSAYSGTVRNDFLVQSFDSSGQRIGSPVVLSADNFPRTRPIEYGVQAAPDGGYMLFKGMTDTSNSGGCYGAMSEPRITSFYYYDENLVPKQILAPTHCGDLMALQGDQYMLFGTSAMGPYSQLIDGNGQFVGPQKPIAAPPDPRNPALTRIWQRSVLTDGSYLLIWFSGTDRFEGQRYTSKGDPIGNVFGIATLPKTILPLSGGDVILAWNAPNEVDINPLDVYTQRLVDPEEKKNASKQSQRKACMEIAKSLKGQARKAFMDKCFVNGLN
jgi:hypothetical protein